MDQQSRDQTDQIENEDDVDRMDEDMFTPLSPKTSMWSNNLMSKQADQMHFTPPTFFLIIYTDKHNTNYNNTHGCNISTYLVNVGYLKKIVLFCHISNMGQFLETLKAVQTDRNKELFVFVVTSKHKFSSKRNISIILKPLNYVMQSIGPLAQNPYSK